MAVRRISDLPELYSNYPNANLSSCLFEVSYNPHDQVYQSFYVHADKLLSAIVEQIPEIPRASKTEFGAVRIGNNINVVENGDEKGLISVNDATTEIKGVIKSPGSNIPYLGTNANGDWEAHELSITVETVDVKSATFKYHAIDAAYPIGGIYITTDINNPWPPGFHHMMDGTSIYDVGNVAAAPTSIDGVTHWIHWAKHSPGFALWSSVDQCGKLIHASIPPMPYMQTASTGAHQHSFKYKKPNSVSDRTSGSHHNRNGVSGPTWDSGTTDSDGAHVHAIEYPFGVYSTYGYDGNNGDWVRPTSVGAIFWQRSWDYVG